MYCGRAQAFRSSPGNGRVQGVIHFEGARAIAVTLQETLIRFRESLPGELQKLPRSDIAKDQFIVAECREIIDPRRGPHRASKCCEMGAERCGQRLRSAA